MEILKTLWKWFRLRGKALMIYSDDRRWYYIPDTGKRPTTWLSVDVIAGEVPDEQKTGVFTGTVQINTDDGRVYYRKILPFAFYELHSGKRERISRNSDFYLDYASHQR